MGGVQGKQCNLTYAGRQGTSSRWILMAAEQCTCVQQACTTHVIIESCHDCGQDAVAFQRGNAKPLDNACNAPGSATPAARVYHAQWHAIDNLRSLQLVQPS